MKTHHIQVSVVAYQADGVWVAQCLEHDIAAFAKSAADLPVAFDRAMAENLCVNAHLGRPGLDGIDPAPDRFREMFDGDTLSITPNEAALKADHTAVEIIDFRLAA